MSFRLPAGVLKPVVRSLDPAQRSPALAGVVDAAWPLLLHTMSADPQQLTQEAVLQAAQVGGRAWGLGLGVLMQYP